MHKSVMSQEVLFLFHDKKMNTFCDGTVGAGGHSLLILEAHPELTTLFAFDQDLSALDIARTTLAPFIQKCQFFHANFEEVPQLVGTPLDGALFDLGCSSMQLDEEARGFSFQKDGPLDMRMNQNEPVTAAMIVNEWDEEDLANLFYRLAEERFSRRIAKKIVEKREQKPFETTLELANCIESAVGRRGRIHPATRVFQALRMEVNHELESIEKGLKNAISLLKPGARLCVISFHSGEDRLVKWLLRKDETLTIITKKPLIAQEEEIASNPRARSAKLRCAEKK